MNFIEVIGHHKSKRRIRELGEVFTPESYVEEMLDLLSKNKKGIWSDEETTFFEPCAGHGNIVVPIYRRRLEGFYKRALSMGKREASFFSIANSLNTLWALDIDSKNVEDCRARILSTTFAFMKVKLEIRDVLSMFSKHQDFFAHLLASIKWHVEVNETLSALSEPCDARANANLTKAGGKWFVRNGHHQVDFDLTWVKFFERCESRNTVPLEYERASRFIEAASTRKIRGFEDYEFAKKVIGAEIAEGCSALSNHSVLVGA